MSVTPGKVARLARQTYTKIGTFMPGLPVAIIRWISDDEVVVCFDLDHHPAGICHSATIPHHHLLIGTQ